MNGNNNDPMRTAAARVQASKAIYRIMRAAVASGGYGAAAAAVRETLPVLFKLLIGVFLAAGVFSVVILTALPNIFFGFRSSHTDAVIRMTDQAAAIGGAYMSLEDFESAYIDSVVENIAEAYEEIGVTIDHIIVNNAMGEDDLLWLIAIHSVAYQQELDAMSTEYIHEFCKASIFCAPRLHIWGEDEEQAVTTLTVKVERLDPEEWMDLLGFDDDAKLWADKLFEIMKESNAINDYASYYDAGVEEG